MLRPAVCVLLVVLAGASSADAQQRRAFRYVGHVNAVQPASAEVSATSLAAPACGEAACAEKVCRLHVRTEQVEKSCFEVERDAICIPGITFPWEPSPCAPVDCHGPPACPSDQCGRVRYVSVPRERDYACGEKCVCAWKLEDAPSACGSPPALPVPPAPERTVKAGTSGARQANRVSARERHTLSWLRWR